MKPRSCNCCMMLKNTPNAETSNGFNSTRQSLPGDGDLMSHKLDQIVERLEAIAVVPALACFQRTLSQQLPCMVVRGLLRPCRTPFSSFFSYTPSNLPKI